MSDPTPPLVLDHHRHHKQQQPQPQSQAPPPLILGPTLLRENRKGNWTLHETLVLITAKKLDDERRSRGSGAVDPTRPSSSAAAVAASSSCKSAELRWKWVENYCWAHGCLRSQNQCNDKWDNLLRDYKKVREYQARSSSSSSAAAAAAAAGDQHRRCPPPTYWNLEKHERKERNLPTNLAFEVFEALQEVINRKQITSSAHKPTAATTSTTTPPAVAAKALPAPPPPAPPSARPVLSAETTDSSGTELGSDRPDSDTKRRRLRTVGSSIVRSASVLSRTLLACEEKKDKRHRDVVELEERKLQMEENRTEASRQGIAGLISAVNNLSGAIHTLVSSDRNDAR